MIRQFDVIPNPSARSRPVVPYVVVVQSHLYDEGPTLLVAPLMRMPDAALLSEVSLKVHFLDEPLILMLSELGAIDRQSNFRPLGSLVAYEDDIRRAIDRLFTGF